MIRLLLIFSFLILATNIRATSASTPSPGVSSPSASLADSLRTVFLGHTAAANGKPNTKLNRTVQEGLRAQLEVLLAAVEPQYKGLLRRAHELKQPVVASLLQDLLLLQPRGTDPKQASTASRGAPQRTRLSETASPPSLAAWAKKVRQRVAQLPANMSYPVVRRVLTAVVVRAWLDRGDRELGADDAAAVRDLFLQLCSLHLAGATHRGIMEYQHVSKSGGTSWCHAARLNGCTTQRFDRFYVCGVKAFEDKVRWVDGAAHRRVAGGDPTRWALHGTPRSPAAPGCAGRGSIMRSNHWTYYSNEYTLTGGEASMSDVEVCSQDFVTALLVRHPQRRLASHLRFLLLHYRRFMDEQYQQQQGGQQQQQQGKRSLQEGQQEQQKGPGARHADFFKTYARANATFWRAVAPAIADNYYTRTLLGEAVWHEPVGALNTTHHLPAARLVLLQYDIIVPLEAPKALTSRLLEYGAGWPLSYTDVHDKNITALQEYFNFDPSPYMPPQRDLDTLLAAQGLDMQLYGMAVLAGQLDALVYDTAAAAGIHPWTGIPKRAAAAAAAAEDSSGQSPLSGVGCGLLRGPDGGWGLPTGTRRRRRRSVSTG